MARKQDFLRYRHPLLGKEVFLIKGGFQIRRKMEIAVRPRYIGGAYAAKRRARFEQALVQVVLRAVAGHVASQIADRIPSGRDGTSYGDLKSLWSAWAEKPYVSGTSVWLGDVGALDAASRYRSSKKSSRSAKWRYGAWFNLEWGREWPSRTDKFIYQENPGPAKTPSESKPPGAGPEDIEMKRWLKRSVSARGGISMHNIEPSQAYERLQANQSIQKKWEQATARSRTQRGKTRERSRKLAGQFGQAPIRLGFVEGVQIANREVPALLQRALKSIGKGR